MSSPERNSWFCFHNSFNVPRDEIERNFHAGSRENKTTDPKGTDIKLSILLYSKEGKIKTKFTQQLYFINENTLRYINYMNLTIKEPSIGFQHVVYISSLIDWKRYLILSYGPLCPFVYLAF